MRPAQVKRVIQEMRTQGYIVRVKHLRPTTDSTKKHPTVMTAKQARDAGVELRSDVGETHVSVYEHSNPTVRLVHETARNHMEKPHQVDSYWDDKKDKWEKVIVNRSDHFRKDLGTAVALGRALDKLHQAGILTEVRV